MVSAFWRAIRVVVLCGFGVVSLPAGAQRNDNWRKLVRSPELIKLSQEAMDLAKQKDPAELLARSTTMQVGPLWQQESSAARSVLSVRLFHAWLVVRTEAPPPDPVHFDAARRASASAGVDIPDLALVAWLAGNAMWASRGGVSDNSQARQHVVAAVALSPEQWRSSFRWLELQSPYVAASKMARQGTRQPWFDQRESASRLLAGLYAPDDQLPALTALDALDNYMSLLARSPSSASDETARLVRGARDRGLTDLAALPQQGAFDSLQRYRSHIRLCSGAIFALPSTQPGDLACIGQTVPTARTADREVREETVDELFQVAEGLINFKEFSAAQQVLEAGWGLSQWPDASQQRGYAAERLAILALTQGRVEAALPWIANLKKVAADPKVPPGERKLHSENAARLTRLAGALSGPSLPVTERKPFVSRLVSPPKGDAGLVTWQQSLENVPVAFRSSEYEIVLDELVSGKLVLSAAGKTRLGLTIWLDARFAGERNLAERAMKVTALSEASVARWVPDRQAAFAQTMAEMLESQGQSAQALTWGGKALRLWQAARHPQVLGSSYKLLGAHLQNGDTGSAKSIADSIAGMPVIPDLEASRGLIAAVASARVQAEVAGTWTARQGQLLREALHRYVGSGASPLPSAWPTQAVVLAQGQEGNKGTIELDALAEVLGYLERVNEDLCEPDLELAAATLFQLLQVDQFLKGRRGLLDSALDWKTALDQAQGDIGRADAVVEIAVRAAAQGRMDLVLPLYPWLQQQAARLQDRMPRPAGRNVRPYEVELRLLESAQIEQAMLADDPALLGRLLESGWNRQLSLSELANQRRGYGDGQRPQNLLHLLTYTPTLSRGRCDLSQRAHPRVAIAVVRGGELIAVVDGPSVSEVLTKTAELKDAVTRRQAQLPQSAADLFSSLLRPGLELLGTTATVDLLQDPVLDPVPHELLIATQDSQWRGSAVRRLLLANTYESLLKSKPTANRAVVIAAPNFGTPTEGRTPFPPLLNRPGF